MKHTRENEKFTFRYDAEIAIEKSPQEARRKMCIERKATTRRIKKFKTFSRTKIAARMKRHWRVEPEIAQQPRLLKGRALDFLMFSKLRNTRDLKIKVTHAFNFVFSLFILQKRICGEFKRLSLSRI